MKVVTRGGGKKTLSVRVARTVQAAWEWCRLRPDVLGRQLRGWQRGVLEHLADVQSTEKLGRTLAVTGRAVGRGKSLSHDPFLV